ncbi:MAG: hypothetical protein ACN4GM_00360 [Gammaproteobacteria bacterium]
MPKIKLLIALLPSLLIMACSPHPSSGEWHNISNGDNEINMITVMFDGKAQMYGADKELIIRRCFWAGEDKTTINLTCVHPDDTDTDINYRLQVSDGQAILLQANHTIARYRKL